MAREGRRAVSASAAADAARFRPTDPGFLHDPYPTYRRLRAEAPVFFHAPWRRWIVTRHADVSALLRDRRLGRVDPNATCTGTGGESAFERIQRGSLLEIEPPAHSRIRAVVHEAFTPKHVRALSGRIDALTARLAAELEDAPGREADLLRSFAEPLPVTVIAELLGIPAEARDRLLPWSKAIIGMFEPERTPAAEAAAQRAAAEFSDYVRALLPHKRRAPAEDLLSRMVAVHDADPARLSEDELVANAILFLDAGHEAVVNVLGNGFLALLRHPAQLARVRTDPGFVPSAVEEMMRYDTPLQFFERLFLEDVRLGPHAFARGDRVCLYYGSANRDEDVFDEAATFDVGRSPNPHIAFGLGLHYCIGAPLARLELASAVHALLRRFPRLELRTSTPRYLPKNVFRYLESLPVGF